MTTILILTGLFIAGFGAATILGTQAYFRGEQTKPIHERNWNSESFEEIAQSVTGKETDYSKRTPAYGLDAYSGNTIASR
ncbi:photosystem II protein, Psb35-related [Lusitaniella coriacea]|uniref:photosystem II protein, Psb35-related n=1 Tax=Lusitaniella coriacea TaxID=1983105 RepID=UPI003CF5D684